MKIHFRILFSGTIAILIGAYNLANILRHWVFQPQLDLGLFPFIAALSLGIGLNGFLLVAGVCLFKLKPWSRIALLAVLGIFAVVGLMTLLGLWASQNDGWFVSEFVKLALILSAIMALTHPRVKTPL